MFTVENIFTRLTFTTLHDYKIFDNNNFSICGIQMYYTVLDTKC